MSVAPRPSFRPSGSAPRTPSLVANGSFSHANSIGGPSWNVDGSVKGEPASLCLTPLSAVMNTVDKFVRVTPATFELHGELICPQLAFRESHLNVEEAHMLTGEEALERVIDQIPEDDVKLECLRAEARSKYPELFNTDYVINAGLLLRIIKVQRIWRLQSARRMYYRDTTDQILQEHNASLRAAREAKLFGAETVEILPETAACETGDATDAVESGVASDAVALVSSGTNSADTVDASAGAADANASAGDEEHPVAASDAVVDSGDVKLELVDDGEAEDEHDAL